MRRRVIVEQHYTAEGKLVEVIAEVEVITEVKAVKQELWDADPKCEHDVQAQWSGIKCVKCGGWFCH